MVLQFRYLLPNRIGQRGRVGHENQHAKLLTLLKDEHVQELEEELKENNMKWDVIGLGEVRRKEESFTTLQSGHLLYHSEANNGRAGFLSPFHSEKLVRVISS